jgi:hypothetical protein
MRTAMKEKNRARRMVAGAERKLAPRRRGASAREAGGVSRRIFRAANASHLVNGVPNHSSETPFIVIAPTGVFVIETMPATRNTAAGGPCDGHARDREALRAAHRAADTVRDLLHRRGLDASSVQAMICLPPASLARPQYRDDVLVARPWQLAYLIRHWGGHVLGASEATRVFAALQGGSPLCGLAARRGRGHPAWSRGRRSWSNVCTVSRKARSGPC